MPCRASIASQQTLVGGENLHIFVFEIRVIRDEFEFSGTANLRNGEIVEIRIAFRKFIYHCAEVDWRESMFSPSAMRQC